jgi:hypothetical protein
MIAVEAAGVGSWTRGSGWRSGEESLPLVLGTDGAGRVAPEARARVGCASATGSGPEYMNPGCVLRRACGGQGRARRSRPRGLIRCRPERASRPGSPRQDRRRPPRGPGGTVPFGASACRNTRARSSRRGGARVIATASGRRAALVRRLEPTRSRRAKGRRCRAAPVSRARRADAAGSAGGERLEMSDLVRLEDEWRIRTA